jgi:thiol-disulfide isomerase/thioredoxin
MPLPRRTFLALPALLGLAACTDVDGTDGKQWISGEGRIISIPEKDRGAPVSATGKDLDGNPLEFATYRGKAVLASVWGSWCPPCRTEMPKLVQLAGQLDAQQAQVLGVNIRESGGTPAAKSFTTAQQVPFPSFYDPGSSIPLALSTKLAGPYSLPASAILDTQGRVAGLVIGAIPSVLTMRDILQNVYDTGSIDG